MYKRILVAIDASPTSQKAFAEALALAKGYAAALCIAHAADESGLAQHGMGLGTYIDVDKVKEAIHAEADQLLAQAQAKAKAEGVEAEVKVLEATDKRVADQIVEGAAAWQADLVVVGTHGRRGVDRLLVGSVAERLTRIATTSLLLVRG
ncbi:MAG: universal stress protein [Betaproteobacteria bacterium]|nr:universal stress protein [Betaproteobacteria bacterium]